MEHAERCDFCFKIFGAFSKNGLGGAGFFDCFFLFGLFSTVLLDEIGDLVP